ncbi:SMP-30/gluconolactonase/LRE family protein [Saprospiraceae bacterium]|nr:SMP-30/gluconolactonase/LRE family protein [Saprospiraceae bacterium]MDC3253379.1 SMP-30/gluconolactonase/LRE family protein [bacterium]
MKVEPILKIENTLLGEGPVWNYKTQELLWVDIPNGLIHTCNLEKETRTTDAIGQMVGAAIPCDNGELLLAMQNGFAFFNPITKELQNISDPESDLPLNRFNDGKCDPAGRLWAGTMATNPPRDAVGSLYRMGSDLKVNKVLSDIKVSNGLAWTKAGDKMFYIDTRQFKMMSFDYDLATGEIENQQDFLVFEKDLPDGMTIDENDNLWVCFYLGGKVVCFDSKTGKQLDEIKIPALCTTSCTFGGENLDTLFITSGAKEGDEFGGTLFAVQPGVKGRKLDFFKTK